MSKILLFWLIFHFALTSFANVKSASYYVLEEWPGPYQNGYKIVEDI